ncbi:zinc knuckle CX2CX4HX4C [Artemisia annua]|uniref:Zinc knuckle CX2CX4HX4C n=1 Tax=Artemisia annua TaxID=35608 RepID=A0A2U1KWW9_ARTAN|nr:zinc knuckle CX2CX4HX4C [Artemisia annua]
MVSSIGVPIIMDRMTTSICEKPYGRASFARLLVEIDSNKALVDNLELWYESLGKILRLRVEYTWVPPRCEEFKVYGRYTSECVKKVNMVSKVNKDGENVKVADTEKAKNVGMVNNGDGDEGWQTAVNRRNNMGAGGKGQLGVTIEDKRAAGRR